MQCSYSSSHASSTSAAICNVSIAHHVHRLLSIVHHVHRLLSLVSVCSALPREILLSTLFILLYNLTNLSKTDVRSISSGVKLGNILMSTAAKHCSTFISSNFWNAA